MSARRGVCVPAIVWMACAASAALASSACSDPPAAPTPPRELSPLPNPFGPGDAIWAPQPPRDKPSAIVAHPDGRRVFVALAGSDTEPRREVAVIDAESLRTLRRVEVGSSPTGLAVHPGGRFLAVTCRFARFVSIVDLESYRVVREVEVPWYTESIAFSPDGSLAALTNRWKDSIIRWRVRAEGSRLEVTPVDPYVAPDAAIGLPVPANPRRAVFSPDGARLLVASETSLSLTMFDTATWERLGVYLPNSPVLDVAVLGGRVYLLHTGSGTQHPPDDGFDGDGDGLPGDGTANLGFQDLQNELDVVALSDLERLHRYTSDTICCRDYRDVDPDRPDSGAQLLPIDQWPPSRVAFLPPRENWIVAGAMPERIVPIARADGRPALAVVYAGTATVQTFDVDPSTGALAPRETAETGLYRASFGAGDAVALDGGRRLLVLNRLAETITELDLQASPDVVGREEPVGDVSGGAFPSTDVELGEAFNTMTAAFSVDGDQVCIHCHRDGTALGKPVSMPLLETPVWGIRNVMSYRQAYDSRPWFVEAGMGEENFFPVINEFARKENFCCEQSDPRVWSRYPTREECVGDGTLEGCSHVLSCLDDPPPECAARPYGSPHLTRDRHFRASALAVLGREESFGDSLFAERVGPDGRVEKRPVPLGFDGITRALGTFLLAQPRALPNPSAAWPTAEARRGAQIYASSEAGCAFCHPLPVTAASFPTVATEAPGPISFPYVVTPLRGPGGSDVDRVNPGFLGTFPIARQDEGGLRVGVAQLRGAWDRVRFLHHGQARSLREVLATPGHPGLRPGERGFNERDGQPDTHGGTSRLSAADLEALGAFLETL